MHIYAFGSLCRGEVDSTSDVDLLSLVTGKDQRFNPDIFSVYSYSRIRDLWHRGNPFGWHLHLESRLIYSDDGVDFLKHLGTPKPYDRALADCEKFRDIFEVAVARLESSTSSPVFELSNVFLSIRNFATCYSLQYLEKPDFSRHSAINLSTSPLQIGKEEYQILENARILSTRGIGNIPTPTEIALTIKKLSPIRGWMAEIIKNIK
jgi:hypothetical protein